MAPREEDVFNKSHRELYPDQYTDALVGKNVNVHSDPKDKLRITASGIVERVVTSRWGRLAHLENTGDTWYLVNHCSIVTEDK